MAMHTAGQPHLDELEQFVHTSSSITPPVAWQQRCRGDHAPPPMQLHPVAWHHTRSYCPLNDKAVCAHREILN